MHRMILCSLRTGIVLLVLLAGPAGGASATVYSWRGLASGNPGADGTTYDLSANWIPIGIPAPGDYARFDTPGTTPSPLSLTAPRYCGTLEVSGTAVTLQNDPHVMPSFLVIGGASGAGTLTLTSGSMLPADWTVGGVAPGTVRLENGATVEAANTAFGGGSTGTLQVDGPGSVWAQYSTLLNLGQGANPGVVSVTNGGLFTSKGILANKSSITIDGAGSRWVDTGNLYLQEGPTISGGATAGLKAMQLTNPSDAATALVTGPGSELKFNGQIEVWRPGIAATNGGHLITQAATILNSLGFAEVDGAGSRWNAAGLVLVDGNSSLIASRSGEIVTSGQVFIGNTGVGYATLFSGSRWTYSGPMTVGWPTPLVAGNIQVSNGSLLEGPGITIHSGRVVVTDAGSRWHITGSQSVNGACSVPGPAATVEVKNGAELIVDGTINMGLCGALNITGGALLQADQLSLECGNSCQFGAYSGIVRTNRLNKPCSSCDYPDIGRLELGHAAGLGSGLLTIPFGSIGGVSTHVVGYDAPATFTVSGQWHTQEMILGDLAEGDGTCIEGGTTDVNADETVGRLGRGYHQQVSGSTTIDRHLFVASEPGSFGHVKITGGTINVGASAFIGGSRSGPGGHAIFEQTGGATGVTDTIFVFPGDSLLVSNGALYAAVIDVMGGNLASDAHIYGKVINRGEVSCAPDTSLYGRFFLSGDFVQAPEGLLRMRVLTPGQHDSLVVGGTISLAGTLRLEMDRRFAPVAGQRIRLASAAGFTGAFQSVIGLPPPADGVQWELRVEDGSLFLVGVDYGFLVVPATSPTFLIPGALLMLGLGAWALRRRA